MRRFLLALLIALLWHGADARSISFAPGLVVPNNAVAVSPEVDISYGQSWRSLDWPSWSVFGLNPNGALALRVNSIGTPTFAPGPLSNGAGVSLTGNIIGAQVYAATDTITIGRTATLARQLLRLRDGQAPTPIIEFSAAYPSSTWTQGGGGGLSPGSSFTASASNDALTVSAVATGTLAVSQPIVGTGIATGTRIIAVGTGTGGSGTYTIGIPQTVLSGAMTASGAGSASFTGSIGGGTPSTVLTVAAVTSGTVAVGQTIAGTGVLANTTITSQLSGAAGGVGTYNTEVGSVQSFSSRTVTGANVSWTNMLTIINQANKLVASQISPAGTALRLTQPVRYRSVGYTQGGSTDDTQAGKEADLAAMVAAFDALNLPGTSITPLSFYIGLPAAVSNATVNGLSNYGTVSFSRTNAASAGGTYSGRIYFTAPSYPWQFAGPNDNGYANIHTGPYGAARWGELEGYVRHLVEDLGIAWTPLWRPLSGGAITEAGQVITVPLARPPGPDFATGVLSWQNNADDGIEDWPAKGFHVRRGGTDLTVTPAISGMNVTLTVTETINSGDSLEVSYDWYGPGGSNPGLNTGVGGNLVMQGPPSVLFPNGYNGHPKTIDAWAVPFVETITAP